MRLDSAFVEIIFEARGKFHVAFISKQEQMQLNLEQLKVVAV
jgi:hypothetical protein